MKYRVTDIEYDTETDWDEQDRDEQETLDALPTTLVIELDLDDIGYELSDQEAADVVDAVSDETGWLVNSCAIERLDT
ncbi:MAG: hypothetical protein WC965_01040 [Thiohalomonadaceae bacterium]